MSSAKLYAISLIAIPTLLCNTVSAQTAVVRPTAQTTATSTAVGTNRTWAPIAEKDISHKKRLWLDVDAKSEKNAAMAYTEDGNALIDVMINGVNNGKIVAYSAKDDKFSTKLTTEEFTNLLESTYLAARLTTPAGKEIIYQSGSSRFRPENVSKFRIKEDQLAMKDGRPTVTRILGIAPIVELVNKKGEAVEQPLFWLYYPDALSYLAASNTSVSSSGVARTWADVLEEQQFSGVVIKEGKAK
jgi:hypothetical protein